MNIKWPEKRETFDGEGYEQGYNDAIDACKKAVEEAQKQEHQKICENCGKWTQCLCIKQEPELVELDAKLKDLINNAYHATRSAQSYGENYHVGRAENALKEALDLFPTLGTPKPRPVVTVDKLADIVQNAGADWENLHDPITPFYVYIAQAIVDYLKEKE